MKKAAFFVALAGCSLPALATTFTSGNLVVVRLGDGVAPLGTGAAATFLDEYTPTGTLVQSIPMPTSASGSQRAFTTGPTATSEGQLTRSANGQYLTLGGYDAIPGTASVGTSASATINRVVGRVDFNGVVDTSTAFSDAFSGASIRSVASSDGINFWAGGGNSGVRALTFGGSTTTQVTSSPTNVRFVNIFNSQLYMGSASGAFIGVSSVGTGLPTSLATATLFPGMPFGTTPSPEDFYLASPTTLYLADDSAGNRGIQRWDLSAGTWTRTTVFTALTAGGSLSTGVFGLTGGTDGSGNTVLYATSYTSTGSSFIYSLTDTGPASTINLVATAGANTRFRGIDFAPIPTPGSVALLALGGVFASRRRR